MKTRKQQKSAAAPSIAVLLAGCLLAGIAGCGGTAQEETSPPTVSDHIGKARVFYRQENYPRAVEMYHKALALDPESSEAYLQLGIIYDDNLKDKALAVSYYREYLRLEPESDTAGRVREWLERILSPAAPDEPVPPPPRRTSSPATAPVRVSSTPTAVSPPRRTPSPPPPAPEAAAAASYTVQGGDTLAAIARKLYGDPNAWNRIYQANRDQLENPHALKIGQVLTIPR